MIYFACNIKCLRRKIMNNNFPFIFISYAHLDIDAVLPVIQALKANNFNVWYDSGIEAGTEWPEFIAEKILDSTVVVAFLSKNSLNSHNCRREINFAIETQKELLVVYLEDLDLTPGMRMQLNTLQAMYKTRSTTDEEFFSAVCQAKILQPCLMPCEKEVIEAPAPVEAPAIAEETNVNTPTVTEAAEAPAPQPAKQQSKPSRTLTDKEKEAIVIKAIAHYNNLCSGSASKIIYNEDISPKQMTNALYRLVCDNISPEEVLGFHDTTLFYSGKEGYVITKDKVYYEYMKTQYCHDIFGVKMTAINNLKNLLLQYDNKIDECQFSIYSENYKNFFDYIINFDYTSVNAAENETKSNTTCENATSDDLVIKAVNHTIATAEKTGFTFLEKNTATEKRITNAIKKYAPDISFDDVLFIFDTTLSANGKSGYLITKDAVYSSNKDNGCVKLFDIAQVEVEKSHITILYKNGKSKRLFFSIYAEKFYTMFKYILDNQN